MVSASLKSWIPGLERHCIVQSKLWGEALIGSMLVVQEGSKQMPTKGGEVTRVSREVVRFNVVACTLSTHITLYLSTIESGMNGSRGTNARAKSYSKHAS